MKPSLPLSMQRFLTVSNPDGTPLSTGPPQPPTALLNRLHSFLPQLAAANAAIAETPAPSADLIENIDLPQSTAPLMTEITTVKVSTPSNEIDTVSNLTTITSSETQRGGPIDDSSDSDNKDDEEGSDSNFTEDDIIDHDTQLLSVKTSVDGGLNHQQSAAIADDNERFNAGDQTVEMVLFVDKSLGELVPNEHVPTSQEQSSQTEMNGTSPKRRQLIVELPEKSSSS